MLSNCVPLLMGITLCLGSPHYIHCPPWVTSTEKSSGLSDRLADTALLLTKPLFYLLMTQKCPSSDGGHSDMPQRSQEVLPVSEQVCLVGKGIVYLGFDTVCGSRCPLGASGGSGGVTVFVGEQWQDNIYLQLLEDFADFVVKCGSQIKFAPSIRGEAGGCPGLFPQHPTLSSCILPRPGILWACLPPRIHSLK